MHIRGKLAEMLKSFFESRARYHIMRHSVLSALTSSVHESTGASFSDYWMLYRYVRLHKPTEILELGPGITTLVMAQALKENGRGRITAMEDVPQYYEATKSLIPDELLPYIDLHLSPRVERRYGPFVGVAYADIPDRSYEFVWVDGPTYDPATSFDADLFNLVGRNRVPLTAYVDSRTGSCFIYHLVFDRKFSFSYLRRVGILHDVSAKDMKSYPQVIARAMKRRQFRRSW